MRRPIYLLRMLGLVGRAGPPFAFGLCICCGRVKVEPTDFVCNEGSAVPKKWVWKQLRLVETGPGWTSFMKICFQSSKPIAKSKLLKLPTSYRIWVPREQMLTRYNPALLTNTTDFPYAT